MSKIRLAVVSTARHTSDILERLCALATEEIDCQLTIGQDYHDFKASSLSRMSRRTGQQGHLMRNGKFTGEGHALLAHPDFSERMEEFIDHIHRRHEGVSYKSHSLRMVQDYIDYYHILSESVAQKLKEKNISHMLFFNIPHLAYDTIFYHVAQALGIKTVIITQTLFPNRFFSMRDVRDYGHFQPDNLPEHRYHIEKEQELDLFYMKKIKQEAEKSGRLTLKSVGQFALFLLMKRPGKALNPFYVVKTLRHMHRVYGQFPKWRDPFATFFHESALAYFDHLAEYEHTKVDLSEPFVYFPLQLQPEMTTSSLGDIYRDQARAIEDLARLLPEGVRILVKENPKQYSLCMRGPLFFHRLNRIPAVTFLPSHANTHELTAKAEFVATITGTVGWEAIRQGKPVLVFGRSWYRSLPGVIEYYPDLTYETITATRIDHSQLELSVGSLLARSHEGVVDVHYTEMVDNYEKNRNTENVARTLLGLLKSSTATTF